MARGRALRLLACLGVAVVLAAGCSGAPQASTSLPSTSSAKPSLTLPPLGPPDFPVPDKARSQDAAGAKAALTYYLDLINHLGASNGQPLRDLSSNCTFCSWLADRVDQDAQGGYSYRGGKLSIDQMAEPAVHDNLAEFTFSVNQEHMDVLGRDGQPVSGRGDVAYHGLRGAAAMAWRHDLRGWVMTQLFFQS